MKSNQLLYELAGSRSEIDDTEHHCRQLFQQHTNPPQAMEKSRKKTTSFRALDLLGGVRGFAKS